MTECCSLHGSDRRRKQVRWLTEGLCLTRSQVPDADLLVHVGDGAPEGLPLLQVRAAAALYLYTVLRI